MVPDPLLGFFQQLLALERLAQVVLPERGVEELHDGMAGSPAE